MKKTILSGVLFIVISVSSNSQGCLPIRNIAGFGQFAQLGYLESPDKWMINISGRYFKAYQSFKGTTKVPAPHLKADRFTNVNRTLNISINKALENNWSLALDVPVYSNASIGKQEHKSGERHSTKAFGLGDIRFTVHKWILKHTPTRKGNIELGLGIKLPTGNYQYMDYFYYDPADPGAKKLAPVDPSIQLGDGGTGFTTEINAFYIFNNHLSLYGNFFYLINPRDQNGVSNQHGNPPANHVDTLVFKSGMDVNSVPDNYTIRTGANYTFFDKLVLTTGFRYEGAPAHDLFGGNNGLRRVGHIFSFEPGLQFKLNRGFIYSFFTLPLARGTIKTVPDKVYSELSGSDYITMGRFANYLVFVGYAFTF
jgi:hypothetical protein